LFILGAGASYAAGLPDGGTLPGHLFAFVGGGPWEVVRNKPPNDYYARLQASLFAVLQELAAGGYQSRWPLDEVFGRFHERLRDDPGGFGATYGLLFEATAHVLYTRSCYAGTTDAYEGFAAALRPGDVVLTFNWDLCPEVALYAAGRSLSRDVHAQPPGDTPWLLKLHGSVDQLIVGGEQSSAPFLEPLGVTPPSPFPERTFELVRLRTYDLGDDVEITLSPADEDEDDYPGTVLGGYDLAPYLLVHTLDEFPSFHLLTPGSPPLLYAWQYSIVEAALFKACPEIERIYVAGYSFPPYDAPVFELLQRTYERAGRPPTAIVNPRANELSVELLRSLFGDYELHACGFQEFDWTAG
jgi:hypothetical protein